MTISQLGVARVATSGKQQAVGFSAAFQLLLPSFPPPGTQARPTRARGVEQQGLRMTQGPVVTKATLSPSNGGLPVTVVS